MENGANVTKGDKNQNAALSLRGGGGDAGCEMCAVISFKEADGRNEDKTWLRLSRSQFGQTVDTGSV